MKLTLPLSVIGIKCVREVNSEVCIPAFFFFNFTNLNTGVWTSCPGKGAVPPWEALGPPLCLGIGKVLCFTMPLGCCWSSGLAALLLRHISIGRALGS